MNALQSHPELLDQTEHLQVWFKPSGLPTAPLKSENEEGLSSLLEYALSADPELKQVTGGFQPHEYGLLHRLDTGTSGLVLLARTQAAFDHYRQLWREGGMIKRYRALALRHDSLATEAVHSLPHTLNWALAHSAKSSKKMVVVTPQTRPTAFRGRPRRAATRLLHLHSVRPRENLWSTEDWEVEIPTGVMHQIRVHFQRWNRPLWGDSLYRSKTSAPPTHRLWLHAAQIIIPSQKLQWECPTGPGWNALS